MIVKQKNTAEIKRHIQKLLTTTKLQDIDDVKFNPGFRKVLLYPTEDLALTNEQFEALLKAHTGSRIFVMQIGYDDDFLSDNNDVYVLSAPCSYEEYENLRFDTITILFSEDDDWIVLIDESAEGGVGLLAATSQVIERFESYYKNSKNDIISFVSYYLHDYVDRKHDTTIIHIATLIEMLRE